MTYAFFGETKGKTSAALGTIVRALGHGGKVRVVFFMKHWQTSESVFFEKLQETPGAFDIKFYKAGDNDFIFVDELVNHTTLENARKQLQFGKIQQKDEKDVRSAQMGYMKALSYLDEKPFLLVLDEITLAVEFGLVGPQQVRHLIERAQAQDVHVVLTGRPMPAVLEELCDLVTRMDKVKHPFDSGVYAVKGLDY
jgi:cob(I)alamin adenosyltransferase